MSPAYQVRDGQLVDLFGGGGTVPTFVLGTTKPALTNTGVTAAELAGVPRTSYVGDHTGGQVLIQNLEVTGRVRPRSGVASTWRNVRAVGATRNPTAGNPEWLFDCGNGQPPQRFEFCTAAPANPNPGWNGFGWQNYTAYRSVVSMAVDGFALFNPAGGPANVTLQGCLVYDLSGYTGSQAYTGHSDGYTHNDAAQLQGGSNMLIEGCNFIARWGNKTGTKKNLAAIMLNDNTGPLTNVVIRNNWFDGGEVAVNGMGLSPGSTITLEGNRFGSDVNTNGNYVVRVAAGVTLTINGNVYESDGSPVTIVRT